MPKNLQPLGDDWLLKLHTLKVKSSAQIHMYDTEDVYKLLNSHNQEFMLNHLVEIQNQTPRRTLRWSQTKWL
jgi:hypothetical protein